MSLIYPKTENNCAERDLPNGRTVAEPASLAT
jgi:hypothetical protein